MSAERDLAKAIHRRAEKAAGNIHTGGMQLATVRQLVPQLEVELHDTPQTLVVGDDFYLSQWLRWFDLNYQLLVGDVLVLLDAQRGWVAVDVVSDRDIDAGIRPSRPPATQTGDMRDAETSTEAGILTVQTVVPTHPDGTVAGPATSTVQWNSHIVRKLPVFDADGVQIGFVPVFGTLP